MNYQKLDAALSSAVSGQRPGGGDEARFEISVRTIAPPNDDQQRELQLLGVQGVSGDERIFTARLDLRALADLSEKPWVRLMSLARVLKPLE